ncbi:MAG: YigZ family protein [Eubacteriales bacterium]
MDEYLVPTAEAIDEFEEKRSRFIGHIVPVDTEEEALVALKKIRETHWNATHNVYAYIIKDGATRFSDDGEPSGTAGMPVLQVLQREEVHNVLCVATRYFGGVKLGGGGLVRAYAKTAKVGLDAAGLSMKQVWSNVAIPCPYNLFERLKLLVEEFEGQVLDIEYGADVTLHTILAQGKTDDFLAKLVDTSNGTVEGIVLGQEYRAFPILK